MTRPQTDTFARDIDLKPAAGSGSDLLTSRDVRKVLKSFDSLYSSARPEIFYFGVLLGGDTTKNLRY